ncbi:MAG: FAD-dependent oxidoreductase [Lentimicrobiaceae bacterium]|jgi:NADH dehydrogenase|nr:FAD-dependent oxidoreductase [Lentimicrobiaceae bacterium]|tara:strand:- start:6966 stop:8273 length:1308 start_codon:yes stop_codon:yes gene_type:complete
MNTIIPNIPDIDKKRIVIIGGGFAGLKFVRKMVRKDYQIVILDKNNYHQFQPLLYQVATSGLEPSAISFPFRKILQNSKHTHFRIATLTHIFKDKNEIQTSIGRLKYDYLILAMGATTNFFGQKNIEKFSLSMKTSADAIFIRNTILQNFENSLLETDSNKIDNYLNIVLVGGGPTGVELAGALAEMKKYIFPKDYPELDLKNMHIALYEASPKLLTGMSKQSSEKALSYLKKLGVEVYLNTSVTDYNGEELFLSDGTTINSKTVVWSAGITANTCKGIPPKNITYGNRILVDRYNRIPGFNNVFVLGDQCYMETPLYPKGHPQVAQTAIQQASNLANNISRMENSKKMKEFEYKDKGSMATIGRNLAVADLPSIKLGGFIAWLLWSVVHLFTIVGIKNKISTFLNWLWSYFTYDQSLRILIIPKKGPIKSAQRK